MMHIARREIPWVGDTWMSPDAEIVAAAIEGGEPCIYVRGDEGEQRYRRFIVVRPPLSTPSFEEWELICPVHDYASGTVLFLFEEIG